MPNYRVNAKDFLQIKDHTPTQLASCLSMEKLEAWAKVNTYKKISEEVSFYGLSPSGKKLNFGAISCILMFLFLIIFFFTFNAIFIVLAITFIIAFAISMSNYNNVDGYQKKMKDNLSPQILAFSKKAEQAIPLAMEKYLSNFPVKSFYAECEKAKIITLKTDYDIKKAEQLFKHLFFWHDLGTIDQYPKEVVHAVIGHVIYAKAEDSIIYPELQKRIPELFKKGKKEFTQENKEKVAQQKLYNAIPHNGTPSQEEARFIKNAKAIRYLKDIEKRKYNLSTSLREIEDQIQKKIDGEKALKQLSEVLMESVAQTKTKDWAFLAGIADGIAGPGAGAAVAINTMNENARIEAENKKRRDATIKTVVGFQNNKMRLSAEKDDLYKAKKLLTNELSNLQKKITISELNSENFKNDFNISKTKIQKTASNILEISVVLENNSAPAVPKGVLVTADGSLQASVYTGKTFVGEATIPLPLYGIECGKTETITGYCPMYMEGDRKYTVKLEPNNLWLMEL